MAAHVFKIFLKTEYSRAAILFLNIKNTPPIKRHVSTHAFLKKILKTRSIAGRLYSPFFLKKKRKKRASIVLSHVSKKVYPNGYTVFIVKVFCIAVGLYCLIKKLMIKKGPSYLHWFVPYGY